MSREQYQHDHYEQLGAYHRRFLRFPFTPWGARYETSLKLLGDIRKDERCLDYGGGDGAMATLLADRGANVTVFDMDFLPLMLSQVDPRLNQVQGFMELPFHDGSFSKVTLLECLEHIPDHLEFFALRECRRVLTEDGKLVISVPSTFRPVSPKHYRHYDYEELISKVKEVGFRVEGVATLRDVLPRWTPKGLMGKAVRAAIYSADCLARKMGNGFGIGECDPRLASTFVVIATPDKVPAPIIGSLLPEDIVQKEPVLFV